MFLRITRLFVIFYILHHAESCGTSTHINIAHEAATFFKGPANSKTDYASIIQKNQDAFVAGNPYPDAMYPSICFGGKYHDAAEDTHWAPFLNATVYYIRENYPQPWDEETEKLVAFLFGFVSHQVADITWHSLAGFQQGFLRTMANVNFHGVFDTAHTDGDVGGDMLTQYDKSDKIVGISKWYVPTEDLYQIYKEYYYGKQIIPKYVIELCSELLYIEYIAETFGGAKIFKPFVKKSPFLLNQLDNYFLGGIHDMAAWTSKIWNETVFMLEHGTSKCNMERSTIHVNCTGYLPPNRGQSANEQKNPGRMYSYRNGGWDRDHVVKIKRKRGVYFLPGKEMERSINGELQRRRLKQELLTTTRYSYAQIGKSIGELRIADESHVVIGAPTYSEKGLHSLGKIWIIPTEKLKTSGVELSDLDSLAVQTLKGSASMSRFGWSVDSTLFNHSIGFEDLIVSAPTTGGEGLQYKGEVYVYFGSPDGISSIPNITLSINDKTNEPKHAHANYGFKLSGSSREIVSTPFYGNQKGMEHLAEIDEVWHRGTQNFSWYGYSRDSKHVYIPQTYIDLYLHTVGSPNFRICYFKNCSFHKKDIQAAGQLHFYNDGQVTTVLNGNEEFEEFGYASSISGNGRLLAVSSPGKNVEMKIVGIPISVVQAGKVSVYHFDNRFLMGTPRLIGEFIGDRSYGRFGESVRFEDVDGDSKEELIVSAPKRTKDITEEVDGAEEGAVFIYKLLNNASVNFGTVQTHQAYKSFIGKEHNARFGESFHVIRSRQDIRLLVGASTSSKYGFKTGLVHNLLLHQYDENRRVFH